MPKKPRRNCKHCNKKLNLPEKIYCSNKCQQDYNYKKRIEQVRKTKNWKSGWHIHTIRKAVIKELGNQCSVCNRTKWENKQIPLVVDHADGNSYNWSMNNIRLVCGNCDMQLPTYKAKNIGKGRYSRRLRYKEGKSY